MKPFDFDFFYLVETYSFEALLPMTQIDNLEERVHKKVRGVFSMIICTTYMGIAIYTGIHRWRYLVYFSQNSGLKVPADF